MDASPLPRFWPSCWARRSQRSHSAYLYEWCCEASHKAGTKRQALEVTTCFVPLLRWIVLLWIGAQLALALDATALGTRFAVLAVCVVYRGCAIPVAWTILPANHPGAWYREWLRL